MPVGQNTAHFTYRFDPGTVPSMTARVYPAFRRNLIVTLKEVADSIVTAADAQLVLLPPDHVPYDNVMGGRDTSLMANSLTAVLMEMVEDGVYYEMKSTEAYYWKFIEFGHFVHTAGGPRWWEGYHFFEKTIKTHEAAIMKAARVAWHMAAIESRAAGAVVGLTEGAINALSARA